jgi:hypothetical protein
MQRHRPKSKGNGKDRAEKQRQRQKMAERRAGLKGKARPYNVNGNHGRPVNQLFIA